MKQEILHSPKKFNKISIMKATDKKKENKRN